MKNKLISLALTGLFGSVNAYAQGVQVVTNPTQQAQDAVNFSTTMAQMAKDFAEAQKIVEGTQKMVDKTMDLIKKTQDIADKAGKQLAALTESKQIATNVVSDSNVKDDPLPQDWQDNYDDIGTSEIDITDDAVIRYEKAKIYDRCEKISNAQIKKICVATAKKWAQDLDFASEAYKNATLRSEQISKLMQAINETTNQKEIAELQARIALEQATIQNEATQLRMFQVIAQQNDQRLREQMKQVSMREIERTEGIKGVNTRF